MEDNNDPIDMDAEAVMIMESPAEEESKADETAKKASGVSLGLFSSFKQEPGDDSEMPLITNSDALSELRKQKVTKRNEDNSNIKRNKMGCFSTFFAILKSYTTLNIFNLPIGFKYGGWLFSPIMLAIACLFETTCAVKLTRAAHKHQIYNYPELVEYALGPTYK